MSISRSLLLHALLLLLSKVSADSVVTQSSAYTSGALGASPFQTFYSSTLEPPEFNILTTPTSQASTNHTFLTYRVTGGQNAPLIMDNAGSLVWSGSDVGPSMDLKVQTYQNQSVLTYFNGSFYSGGYGMGKWTLLSQNYSVVATVTSQNQTADTSDFHEMYITANDTALVESWRVTETDLTSIGGIEAGWTWDCVFQEVDIATQELLFEWRSLEHVLVNETYFEIANSTGSTEDNPFDYCHINALEKTALGNYLISMRGPSTVYHIDGQTGEILWRLGGKNSDFAMGTGAEFYYQHDARIHGDVTTSNYNISIFDNGAGGGTPSEATARGIILGIDTSAMSATLLRAYVPSFNHTAASQGSVQLTGNGNVVVGWGATPYFSEYLEDGTLVQDVQFGPNTTTVQSYRAKKLAWVGYPTTTPSFALNSTGALTAYASWNGATEIATWVLMGGNATTGLTTISNTTKSGFETEMAVTGTFTYVSAAAISSNNTCLGVSDVYQVSSQASTGTAGACPSGLATATSGTGSSGSTTTTSAGVTISASVGAVVLAFTTIFFVL